MAEHHFGAEIGWLRGAEAAALSHSKLEERMQRSSLELYRLLLQGHLDLRAQREAAAPPSRVLGADGVARTHKRTTSRTLATLFGSVTVKRLGFAVPGHTRLHPLDAELQLPHQRYSHPLQRRVAKAAAEAAYAHLVDRIAETTGSVVPKRQAEQLVQAAAVDFEAFYSQHPAPLANDTELLVLSFDGKGVPMRRIDLRPATARAARHRRFKLTKRLSPGEKRGFKRMAEVATVYTIAPFVRTPADIVRDLWPGDQPPLPPRPRPQHKRVWASLRHSPAEVIAAAFDEAERRDPQHRCRWVVLVDGQVHQLDLIQAELKRRQLHVPLVLDVIHVLGYLWKAAWVFHDQRSREAQDWVSHRLWRILQGRGRVVAAEMRTQATRQKLEVAKRKPVDKCADYLQHNAAYLDYPTALTAGMPIATGVIEGACRYLIKDRLEITGARWRLAGAEAVLQLRALVTSGDFEAYWRFHLRQEFLRNYAAHNLPTPPQMTISKPEKAPELAKVA